MTHVPKFGNWEGGDQEAYTAYFDSVSRVRHERARSGGESDFSRQTDSPAHLDAGGRKITESTLHPEHAGRPTSGDSAKKRNGGRDRNPEQSPLHPRYQARVANKGGVSSPSSERKGSSEGAHGVAPLTPSRLKGRSSAGGDDSLEKGAAVPKFGEWDEADPSSADRYTDIFNEVRKERHGSAKAPMVSTETPAAYGYKTQLGRGSSIWCCFGK